MRSSRSSWARHVVASKPLVRLRGLLMRSCYLVPAPRATPDQHPLGATPAFPGSRASRWGVVAASGAPGAETYAHTVRVQPQAVFGKSDVMRSLRRMRAKARSAGIDSAFIHSLDWRRQSNPQLYELALTFLPVRERYIVSERDSRVDRISRAQCVAGLLRIPIDAIGATMAITGESARFLW